MKKVKYSIFRELYDQYWSATFKVSDKELYTTLNAASTFGKFIMKYENQSNIKGDLAGDYSADKYKPRNALTILQYLLDLNACDGALRAYFEIAEDFYREKNNG